MPESKPKIAVLGAGPAGLSAAYAAAASGADVDVYDASRSVGGSLLSRRIDAGNPSSFSYELGATSMQLKDARVAKLIEEVGLQSSILERRAGAKKVYIVHKGSLVPLPTNPLALLQTRLLTVRGKMSIFLEPFARRIKDEDAARKESVRAFFERRFSKNVTDYVVDPAVAGIFSGDPSRMPMRFAFRRLWDTEREKGSLLLPLMMAKKDPDAKALKRSITLEGGMQTLPQALLDGVLQKGGRLYAGKPVRSLNRGRSGHWHVNRRGRYDAVICALPAHALGNVSTNLPLVEFNFSRLMRRVKYAAVGVAVLGFRREQVAHALDGFGVLVPSVEKRKVVGVQFASEGYPEKKRAEDEQDKVFLSVYLGGERDKTVVASENGALGTAKKEVADLLGVKGEPCFSAVHLWRQGIPQFGVGHGLVIRAQRTLERKAPGLVLAGNYTEGVGVADAIISGINAAGRALSYFEKLEQLKDPSKPGWPVGS